MLPCVFFEAEEESEEDLPCMLETTTTTVTGTDDGFATPRDIVDLTEPAQGSQDVCSTVGCLENLLDTFTREDINALAQKADNLQTDIRQGFDRDIFFVKSTSTSKPHIAQRVPGSRDGYSCDKECLGFVSRKICAHTVAVANFSHNLPQFVSWFKKSRRHKENLTSLTTFAVNKAAGRKKKPASQKEEEVSRCNDKHGIKQGNP